MILCEDLTFFSNPCLTCGHTARKEKDSWPEQEVGRYLEDILFKSVIFLPACSTRDFFFFKLTQTKEGRPKRQHNCYWSDFTSWIVLKDSPSFKTDGTRLLVFSSVSTHLSSYCWWINQSLRGFSFGWRILSPSQEEAWRQRDVLAKSWDYGEENFICICFCSSGWNQNKQKN